MNQNLLIVIILTLCNFLIFLALLGIIVRAGRHRRQNTFKRIPNPEHIDDTAQIPIQASTQKLTIIHEHACQDSCGENCTCAKNRELAEVGAR
jgi:hypothetical protein